ncbi:MepB family protein [Sediminibacterium ginsengisoli]|uniref:MepB protein n=1 Tax=Sediminibacterium ginsengisoli TaxID=413434 RepID=A0A1T4P571_9BACT|nr:MepB family protein [Sediminibacterium ginsengisoli]SJZ86582.1 hypothetical protein SAMN04488132_105154 [Sediminibacterium ginsengisoli]
MEQFSTAQEYVFEKFGLHCAGLLTEPESAAYEACRFRLNDRVVVFRAAKITPLKTGQFVTIWKRDADGLTAPFDLSDGIDLFVIAVSNGNRLGQFVFPAAQFHKQGIISGSGKKGKRGIRVYAPWDATESPQAKRTQQWQCRFFLEIPVALPALVEELYLSA